LNQRANPLESKVQAPIGREVVFIAETLAAVQAETGQRYPSGIVPEGDATQARHPVGRAMDQEAVQVVVAPSEGTLKNLMEFGETDVVGHEQSSPHQRAHVPEHDAKLINRKGRYGRFSHAGTLLKPTGFASQLTPRNLPLSNSLWISLIFGSNASMALAWA
jgi:hypothetical protein